MRTRTTLPTRRGYYVLKNLPTTSGEAICLFNNNPDSGPGNAVDNRRREKEIALFREWLKKTGINEIGYGTYPPPGEKLAGYTYAMILDAGETQIGIVLAGIDEAKQQAWEWYEHSKHEETVEEEVQTKLLEVVEQQLAEEGQFDPEGITDARERVISSIVRRRGQSAFRKRLLTAYKGRCAISGCDVEDVLEAAHIIPYKGAETDHTANGLLLRADLHTLFDLGLVAVDEATMQLLIAPVLVGTDYEQYLGGKIKLPDDPVSQPSRDALKHHREKSDLSG